MVRLNAFEKFPLANVSRYANLTTMSYSITYFHSRVKAETESWPDGILADYADCGVVDGVRAEFANATFTCYGRRSF